jgi:hypothetical protein
MLKKTGCKQTFSGMDHQSFRQFNQTVKNVAASFQQHDDTYQNLGKKFAALWLTIK